MSCGPRHCIAFKSKSIILKSKGSHICLWGEHTGDEGKDIISTVPVTFSVPFEVSSVSCGFEHSLLLDSTGRVFSFGKNSQGQLCLPADIKFASSPQATSLINIKQVKAGVRCSFFIDMVTPCPYFVE